MYDGSISAAWTYYDSSDSVALENLCQDIDILDIAKHVLMLMVESCVRLLDAKDILHGLELSLRLFPFLVQFAVFEQAATGIEVKFTTLVNVHAA